MRKIWVFVMLMLAVNVLHAQDQKAKSILDAMSNKYKSAQSFKASYQYILENKVEGLYEEFTGEIYVKGEKFKLDLGEQMIINDGETQWTYLKESNEVNIDSYEPDEEEMTPSNFFDAYKSGYKMQYIGPENVAGQASEIVELQPESTNPSFSQLIKIKLWVKKADHSLLEWVVYDKMGNNYRYKISNYDPKLNASDDLFQFDESDYPGIDVIDLR